MNLKHPYTRWAAALLLLALSFLFAWRMKLLLQEEKALRACQKAFGPLELEQRKAIRLIVQAFDRYGDKDSNKLAYILATAWHESKFRPIKEYRAAPHQTQLYERQNRYWHTGYYGRGFVQLTWKNNYLKMSQFLGVDLLANPELALRPVYAAKILVYGMMHGTFTGVALEQFINNQQQDFYRARLVVNHLDKADKIGRYAGLLV